MQTTLKPVFALLALVLVLCSGSLLAQETALFGDLTVTSNSSDGFPDPERQMQLIRETLGDQVIGMTPICTTFGIMACKTKVIAEAGEEISVRITNQVFIVGIDEQSILNVGEFGKFLQHPENRKALSFDLRDGGYSTFENQENPQSNGVFNLLLPTKDRKNEKLKERTVMKRAGWQYRRDFYSKPMNGWERATDPEFHEESQNTEVDLLPTLKKEEEDLRSDLDSRDEQNDQPMDNSAETSEESDLIDDLFDDPFSFPQKEFDPLKETNPGIIIGMGLAMYHSTNGAEKFFLLPGHDVQLTFLDYGLRPEAITGNFTCVDLFESKMKKYDDLYVFVPLKTLQELRGTPNRANQILIQLKPGSDLDAACKKLQKVFDPCFFTCEIRQEPQ